MAAVTSTSAQRAWAAVAAVATIAAACERKPQPAPAPAPVAPPVAPSAPPPPLSFRQTTPNAVVALTLPAAVARTPALYTKLYADGRNALQAFAEGAKGDLEEQRANGETVTPYRQTLDYTLSAETAKLVGLEAAGMEDTGGAHPNNSLKGLIWDKTAGREVKAAALFTTGADMTAADKALCDAIHAARKARSGDPALSGDLRTCPALKAAALTLAPSSVAGKAGGLVALFPPFALSGGADGGYRIAIPYDTIRPILAPAYAAEFAGAPFPTLGG
jgi:hypothetical protein